MIDDLLILLPGPLSRIESRIFNTPFKNFPTCAHEIVSSLGLVLGTSVLHLALGVVGGILVLVILVATSFFIVCKAKGLTLQKQEVRLRFTGNLTLG